jgi:hypothetical protein
MSDITTSQITLQDLTKTIPQAGLRMASAALSGAALLFPMAHVAAMFSPRVPVGLSNELAAGSLAYALPIVFIAAVAVPALHKTRPFTRLVDMAAAATATLMSVFVIYAFWSVYSEFAAMGRQFGASINEVASIFPISPGLGLLPLAALTALSVFNLVKNR